jgi:dUTP pyrophosphatase
MKKKGKTMDRWNKRQESKELQTPSLKIRLCREGAKLPTKGTSGSAGLDIYATDDITVRPGDIAEMLTGLTMEIPAGYYGLLATRSSMGRRGVRIAAGCNILDSDYREEVLVYLRNDGVYDWEIHKGDRVAQLVIVPYLPMIPVEVEELSKTDRKGGFGSTGK